MRLGDVGVFDPQRRRSHIANNAISMPDRLIEIVAVLQTPFVQIVIVLQRQLEFLVHMCSELCDFGIAYSSCCIFVYQSLFAVDSKRLIGPSGTENGVLELFFAIF